MFLILNFYWQLRIFEFWQNLVKVSRFSFTFHLMFLMLVKSYVDRNLENLLDSNSKIFNFRVHLFINENDILEITNRGS